MKIKTINLTESDLKRIVNHTLNIIKFGLVGRIQREGYNIREDEAYSFGWWWDIVVSISIIKNFIKSSPKN